MKPELIATVCGAALLFLTQVVVLITSVVQSKLGAERDLRNRTQIEADRHYIEMQLERRLTEERAHLAQEMKIQTEANAKALAEQTLALNAETRENRVLMGRVRDDAAVAYKEANDVNRKLLSIGEESLGRRKQEVEENDPK